MAAVARLEADNKGFDDAFDKSERSLDRFLKSENRVESQLGGLAKELSNAQSAGDALAAVMNRVENSLNTSLGVGLAVAVGMSIKGALEAGAKEMTDSLDIINKGFAQKGPDAYGDSVATLTQKLEANEAQLSQVNKRREELDAKKGFFESGFSVQARSFESKILDSTEETNAKTKESILDALAEKESQQSKILALRLADRNKEADLTALQLSYAEKIGAAEQAGQKQVAEALRERQQLEEQLIEKADQRKAAQRRLSGLEGDLGNEALRVQLESGATEAGRFSIASKRKLAQNRNAADSDNYSSEEQARINERASLEEQIRQKSVNSRLEELKLEQQIAELHGTEESKTASAQQLRIEHTKKLLAEEKDVVRQAELRVLLAQQEAAARTQDAARARAIESARSQGRVLDIQDPANSASAAQKAIDSQEERFADLKRKVEKAQSGEERLGAINEMKRLRNEVAEPDLQSRLSYSVDSLTAIGGGGNASGALQQRSTEEERLRLETEMRDYLRVISEDATVLKTK